MLNVWASWCVSCREEHPVLVDLAKSKLVPLYGLNYKDKRDEALAWLTKFGDPYALSDHGYGRAHRHRLRRLRRA